MLLYVIFEHNMPIDNNVNIPDIANIISINRNLIWLIIIESEKIRDIQIIITRLCVSKISAYCLIYVLNMLPIP